jgi:hypothetical protein
MEDDRGTPNCPFQTMHYTDEDYRRLLIEKGPFYAGIGNWGFDTHDVVVVGYGHDLDYPGLYWIVKSSYGSEWQDGGYGKVQAKNHPIIYASLPIKPIPPAGVNYQIKCVDEDGDGYCNWGISTAKPETCPTFCQPEKDCDDSSPDFTTFKDDPECGFRPFRRGDVNENGKVDVGDAIYILNYLFQGGEKPGCLDAADINDDGEVNISDPTYLLRYLQGRIPIIPEPFPRPGLDLTLDNLGCERYAL